MESQTLNIDGRLARVESCLSAVAEQLRLLRIPMPPLLLKVSEVAKVLRVSEKTVRRYIEAEELKASALDLGDGRKVYRVRQADLTAFIEGRHPAKTGGSTGCRRSTIRVPKGLV